MPKRFHDTNLWHEDWFIALPKDYRDFWFYIKDDCDHAGIWKPNISEFNKLYDCAVNLPKAIELFNQDRNGDKRIIVLKNGRWFLTGFIPFQYGSVLNIGSPLHKSIYELLLKNEVNLTSLRPLVEVIGRVKDKVKDKEIYRGDVGGVLEEKFGKIAKKDEVIKFLKENPKTLWPSVKYYLSKRYKDGERVYEDAAAKAAA